MLIPSIDLMGGKIVQLVQGEKKALEFDDFDYWIQRFAAYPLIQLIDLDAAMGNGNNHKLIAMICKRLPCQTGGGIRDVARASELLAMGAKRVILGSSLLKKMERSTLRWQQESSKRSRHRKQALLRLIRATSKVAIKGWKRKHQHRSGRYDPVRCLMPTAVRFSLCAHRYGRYDDGLPYGRCARSWPA